MNCTFALCQVLVGLLIIASLLAGVLIRSTCHYWLKLCVSISCHFYISAWVQIQQTRYTAQSHSSREIVTKCNVFICVYGHKFLLFYVMLCTIFFHDTHCDFKKYVF